MYHLQIAIDHIQVRIDVIKLELSELDVLSVEFGQAARALTELADIHSFLSRHV